jgi:thiosulfate dehydrogenase
MSRHLLIAAALAASFPAFGADRLDGLPAGPLGDAVQRGYEMTLQTQTDAQAKVFLGNALNCTSCHRDAGRLTTPGSLLTTATRFPSYSPREGAVLTLEDRIDNCFMRSMNGMRPGSDSAVTVDMSAYIAWLARGKPLYGPQPAASAPAPAPDLWAPLLKSASQANYARGHAIYTAQCAACHGAGGAGNAAFPPVWGSASYNAGAGLANVPKLAGWVRGNMPLGNAHLSAQDALDVAVYVDAQPRPDFVLQDHLPKDLPADAYNASVRSETSTVTGNLKKAGLAPQDMHD